jgi:hypothetical protein
MASSVKYLSIQISKIEEEYNSNIQKCGQKAESIAFTIGIIGIFSIVLLPIIPILFAVLTYYITYNIFSSIAVGVISWLVGLGITSFTGSESKMTEFLYERYVRKYREPYENELIILKNNLSKAQPLCPTCKEPLSYIQQYQYWYCPKCQKYTRPSEKAS